MRGAGLRRLLMLELWYHEGDFRDSCFVAVLF